MEKKTFRRPDSEAMLRLLERHRDSCAGLILRLAWNMGLSLDEMHDLKWADIFLEKEEIRVNGRTVPMDEDTAACLRLRRSRRFHHASEYAVISDRRRAHMHRVYISRTAREALHTEPTLGEVTLKDLREDFVLRQLERHESAYVARISGLTLATVKSGYLPAVPADGKNGEAPGSREISGTELESLVRAEGAPAGLAIWLVWKLGFELEEIAALEWQKIDWENGMIRLDQRQLPLDDTTAFLLRQAEAFRTPGVPQVLISPHARTPFDVTYLSRVARMALIRGGMDQVTLRDLKSGGRQEEMDAALLAYTARKGSVNRGKAVELLQESEGAAYRRLRRLAEHGKLVRVGAEYYPADSVVPPEEHERVIRDYLKAEGGAYRQDLADLLRIAPKQCGWILQTMVADGRLNRWKQWYTLPEQDDT